jgi:hypothetical protein
MLRKYSSHLPCFRRIPGVLSGIVQIALGGLTPAKIATPSPQARPVPRGDHQRFQVLQQAAGIPGVNVIISAPVKYQVGTRAEQVQQGIVFFGWQLIGHQDANPQAQHIRLVHPCHDRLQRWTQLSRELLRIAGTNGE